MSLISLSWGYYCWLSPRVVAAVVALALVAAAVAAAAAAAAAAALPIPWGAQSPALSGGGLILSNNGGDNLEVDANGAFTFTTAIGAGDAYSVTINMQPNSPVQACTVSNGGGSVAGANITTVVVDCARFAFVANSGSNNISAYLIDNTSGALTAVAGSPFATGANPSAVTVDPNGQFAYVANAGSSNVSAYTINTATGALTAVVGSPFATGARLARTPEHERQRTTPDGLFLPATVRPTTCVQAGIRTRRLGSLGCRTSSTRRCRVWPLGRVLVGEAVELVVILSPRQERHF